MLKGTYLLNWLCMQAGIYTTNLAMCAGRGKQEQQ